MINIKRYMLVVKICWATPRMVANKTIIIKRCKNKSYLIFINENALSVRFQTKQINCIIKQLFTMCQKWTKWYLVQVIRCCQEVLTFDLSPRKKLSVMRFVASKIYEIRVYILGGLKNINNRFSDTLLGRFECVLQ